MNTLTAIEQLVLPLLIQLLTSAALSVASSFATTGRQMNPNISDSDLDTYVNGQLKHWARTHLGFFGFAIDLLWTVPEVQSMVQGIVMQAVANTKPSSPSGGLSVALTGTLTNG